jgi:hypothetical protein
VVNAFDLSRPTHRVTRSKAQNLTFTISNTHPSCRDSRALLSRFICGLFSIATEPACRLKEKENKVYV